VATTIRHHYRAHVRDEIKRAALRQLTERGPHALSVNSIAKELGVSGPALYRYFSGRDALLTELAADAYDELAGAVSHAAFRARRRRPPDRLRAFARAYRRWATAQPHRYGLLFAEPVPGYDAQAPRLVDASQRTMTVLVDLLGDASAEVPCLSAVHVWVRLHGFVSLEIAGTFRSMRLDPDTLFGAELERL
jgi:AcrR family transcriptional regulator